MRRRVLILGAVTAAEALVLGIAFYRATRYIDTVSGTIEKEYTHP